MIKSCLLTGGVYAFVKVFLALFNIAVLSSFIIDFQTNILADILSQISFVLIGSFLISMGADTVQTKLACSEDVCVLPIVIYVPSLLFVSICFFISISNDIVILNYNIDSYLILSVAIWMFIQSFVSFLKIKLNPICSLLNEPSLFLSLTFILCYFDVENSVFFSSSIIFVITYGFMSLVVNTPCKFKFGLLNEQYKILPGFFIGITPALRQHLSQLFLNNFGYIDFQIYMKLTERIINSCMFLLSYINTFFYQKTIS